MNRVVAVALLASATFLHAWDYEGHRIVNNLALDALPADFPAFAKTPEARERIAFLSGEADRWRNSTNHAAEHCASPEHYIDLDDLSLYGMSEKDLTPFRYDFMAKLGEGRVRNAKNFAHIDPAKDQERTRTLIGFLPWAINDGYARIESAFAYLREYEAAGTREEIAQARQNVIFFMGVYGHLIGDAAQPLHTTRHYNGWVGPNPNRYRTNRTIHSWIDGGFLRATRITHRELRGSMRPSKSPWTVAPTNIFPEALQFIRAQEKLVEPLYIMDRDGALTPSNPKSSEGREFIGKQLVTGAQFLSDLWYSAWKHAPEDTFLRRELARRKQNGRDGATGAAGE